MSKLFWLQAQNGDYSGIIIRSIYVAVYDLDWYLEVDKEQTSMTNNNINVLSRLELQ